VIDGQPRKGIAEAGRTGWVYILDRTNGKPLIGIEERPVQAAPVDVWANHRGAMSQSGSRPGKGRPRRRNTRPGEFFC
jgi:glucose dehydrogenase